MLEQRAQFIAGPTAVEAGAALARHLTGVLLELEPELVGLYWPLRAEFNAAPVLQADSTLAKLQMALPFARRSPIEMHYRAWDGRAPKAVDECGIATSDGPMVMPDVVLVPCVGYTASGFRLGYGGGYFDRWLAQHPDVTTVGIAWSFSEMCADDYAAEAHDQPMSLIVTERGVA